MAVVRGTVYGKTPVGACDHERFYTYVAHDHVNDLRTHVGGRVVAQEEVQERPGPIVVVLHASQDLHGMAAQELLKD